MELQPKTRLELIFQNLDLTEFVRKIDNSSSRGPRGYSPFCIIRALLAQQIENIPSRAALVKRLKDDPVFKYACGFDVLGKAPSEATFSRYFAKLNDNGALDELFKELLVKASELKVIQADTVSVDSTKLESYERACPRNQLDENDDTQPDWGAKYDSHHNKITWFGWKLHMACDADSELPLALKITPAHVSDCSVALPLVEDTKKSFSPEYWTMDSAYDTKDIYSTIYHDYEAQAIIPINKRNAKEPPVTYHDFNGTPTCSAGYAMVYWGHDGDSNKFRCPHVLGKKECPHGSVWCSDSNYGMVVKTRVKDDPRFVSTPHRGTKNWRKIYNKRTSIERCFSRLKKNLNLENLTVRGIEKVRSHVLLSMIGLISAQIALEVEDKAQTAA